MDIINTLRHFKVGPFTVFDVLTAYLGIFLLSPLLTKLFAKINLYFSRVDWLWLTVPIGLLFHLALRLNTPLTKMIIDPHGYYAIKALILFMIFMGFRNCRNPQNIKNT